MARSSRIESCSSTGHFSRDGRADDQIWTCSFLDFSSIPRREIGKEHYALEANHFYPSISSAQKLKSISTCCGEKAQAETEQFFFLSLSTILHEKGEKNAEGMKKSVKLKNRVDNGGEGRTQTRIPRWIMSRMD